MGRPADAGVAQGLKELSSRPSSFSPGQGASLEGKKILFAIGSLEVGGAEKQLLDLVSRIPVRYRCRLFTLQGGGPLQPSFKDLNVPVHSCGLHSRDLSKAPWRVLLAQSKLISVIRETRPDIIHAFLPLVTFLGATAGRLCRIPLVITSRRALGTHQERHILLRPLDLIANAWSHRVTVNSKAVWNDVVRRDRMDPRKLVLIYNAVDPLPFESAQAPREKMRKNLGLEGEEKAVIAVANLISYKGHSDLLRAMALALKEVPKTRLLLVGEDRGIGDSLRQQTSVLGIDSRVAFLGQRRDVPELLAASDLSVLASHEEGFSNVILESMAAGLPVVATDVGGNGEAVVKGETGWLVPAKNPEALANRIVDLLKNPARAREWGMRGKERVAELFNVDRMVKEHLRLYEKGSAALAPQ
jgi:glycosyltransferase involved in cell wall biosynthesis